MKKIIFVSLILLSGIYSCSKKISTSSATVSYVASSDGTITMNAVGIGKNKDAAISDAEKNAFEVLFFRGLPNSEEKIALIGTNEVEIKQSNKVYFEKFYEEMRYKTFLMMSVPTTNITKIGGNKKIQMQIQINVSALRKDLEENNIIRKFGY